jgi:predicted DNA-binding protein
MTRIITSIAGEEKVWLDKKALETGVPKAEIVREAIRRMREEEQTAFAKLLERTNGLWKHGDGLRYQRRLRQQWR